MAARVRRPGFTLIELLVVLTIITLLIAILLPALTRGREAARTAVCQSRHRQIAIGVNLYANDNQDYLPTYAQWSMYGNNADTGLWVGRIYRYVNRNPTVFRCPSYFAPSGRNHYATGMDHTKQGMAGWGNGDLAIVGEPGVRIPLDFGHFHVGVSHVRDAGTMSASDPIFPRLGRLHLAPSPNNSGPYRWQESRFPLFAEARHYWNHATLASVHQMQFTGASNWLSLLDGLATIDVPRTAPYYTTYLFSTLHNNGSNVTFADGHVTYYGTQRILDEKPF